jgi:predicted dehydrogenase
MTVKVGIMSFAHLHADSYALCLKQHPQAELVGVADHDQARAKAKALQFETQAFSSYEALLASEAQAVIICSENARHAQLAQMAAAAGKHILCEKPLMTRLEDGKAMLAAAQGAGVHLFTAFPCRFSPVFQQMCQMLQAGVIGELLALRGTNRGSNPGGWFTDPELAGGGAMMDHTVHVADLIRVLTGQEIAQVYAETGNNMFHGRYDDTAMLTLTLQERRIRRARFELVAPEDLPHLGRCDARGSWHARHHRDGHVRAALGALRRPRGSHSSRRSGATTSTT